MGGAVPLKLRIFFLGPCTVDTTHQKVKCSGQGNLVWVAGRIRCAQVTYVLEALCAGETCLLPTSSPVLANCRAEVLWGVHVSWS